MGVCGIALLLIFLCSVVLNKIPACGVAVLKGEGWVNEKIAFSHSPLS